MTTQCPKCNSENADTRITEVDDAKERLRGLGATLIALIAAVLVLVTCGDDGPTDMTCPPSMYHLHN
jgi:hypothetical protein